MVQHVTCSCCTSVSKTSEKANSSTSRWLLTSLCTTRPYMVNRTVCSLPMMHSAARRCVTIVAAYAPGREILVESEHCLAVVAEHRQGGCRLSMWPHPEKHSHCAAHQILKERSLPRLALEVSIPSDSESSNFLMPTGRPHPFTRSEKHLLLDVIATSVGTQQPNRWATHT